MLENCLNKLRKVLVAAMTVALTVTVLQVNTNPILAEDNYTLKINGETANGQTIDYGQYVTFSLGGTEDGDTVTYFYGSQSDFEDEAFNDISSGKITLVPQTASYYLGYSVTKSDDTNIMHKTADIAITVQNGTLAAPSGLSWSGSSANWGAVTTSDKGAQSTLPENAVKNYTVKLYKDTQLVDTQTTTAVYCDFTSKILSSGKGVYTFTVTANSNNIYYNNSAESAASGSYIVPLVTVAKDSGITSVTPTDSFLLLPGNSSHNSKAITATVKSGFIFSKWTGSGVTFAAESNTSTTVTINDNYSGTTDLEIKATTTDTIVPTISSFEKNNSTSLKATAKDSESGIIAYAFSKASSKGNVVDNEWISLTATNEEKTFNTNLSDGGYYYFHVLDAALNHSQSGPVQVTKVVYHNYKREDSSSKTDYIIGNESYTALTPTSTGYVFGGWYTDSGLTTEYGTIGHATTGTVEVYAKWTQSTMTITGPTAVSKTYDGQNSTLSVSVSGTASYSYQWHKIVEGNDTAISGATSSTYNVKNVADSAQYYVTVTAKDAGGTILETKNSSTVTVAIEKAALTVTADNKSVTYGTAAPTYTVSYDGFVNGETSAAVTVGSINCDYTTTSAVGTYEITPSGYTADNYKITHTAGTLTVTAKTSGLTAVFTNASEERTYTGNAITPAVTVKCGSVTLEETTHYTIAYTNNINATTSDSKAKATITMCGNYSGTITLEYEIKKATYAPTVVLNDWTYGDTANTPTLSTSSDNPTITYEYAAKGSTKWSTTQPVDAGTYKVKATLSETANYKEIKTAEKEFTIKKREITLTANSATYKYDGTEHKDAGYTQTGTFATNEGFASVVVTGAQTIVGQSNNTITYTLTSVTKADNYNITTEVGVLKVEKDNLTTPSNAKWTSDPGNISFVPVTKKNTVISTVVKLYHYDGTDYTLVATKTITAAECSLEEEIRADALEAAKINEAYSYYFTLQSVPTGGTDKDYYIESGESDKVGPIYTGVIKAIAGDYAESINFVNFDTAETICMIEGESATVVAQSKEGYSLYYNCFNTNKTGAITIADSVFRNIYSGGETRESTIKLGKLSASFYDGTIWAITQDSYPTIYNYSATNDPDTTYSKVVLSFNLRDKGGVTKYLINNNDDTPETTDPNWIAVPAAEKNDFDGTYDVQAAGAYYIHVMDNVGNISNAYTPITVYQVTLNAGTGTGSDVVMYKVENTEIKLPANPFTKDGYGFQNWQGVNTGLHYDKGNYGENASDTLTALWTDVHYDYTVNYFYMNLNGGYETTASKTKTFNVLYGTTVSTSTVAQEAQTGFTLDSTKASEITVNEEGKVLNVYYARNKYTISYKYKAAGSQTQTDFTPTTGTEFYYGADLTGKFNENPTADGYDFVGWDFGELGSQPETMPARNFTVTGEFVAKATTYKVRYYFENLTSDNRSIDPDHTYALNTTMNQDGIVAKHGDKITVDKDSVPEVSGFTFSKAYASYGDVGGTTVNANAAASIEAEARYGTGNELYINIYYTRNTYNVTLNVLEITPTEEIKEYTNTWSFPYGYAFATDEMTGYANYNSSSWNHDDKYILAKYIDYSTGAEPSTMPAGNVTITRQFVQLISGEYKVEVYLETDTNGQYTLVRTNGYYGNVQDTVTVGAGSTYTVDYTKFGNSISDFDHYNYKTVTQAEIDAGTITGVNGPTVTSGVVTDTNNQETELVLRIFFERKTMPINIYYYAVPADGTDQVLIGTVTKSLKWGTNRATDRSSETESEYELIPTLYFESGATYDNTENYNFKSHNFVISFTMSYGVYNSDGVYVGSTKLNTIESLSAKYYLGTDEDANNVYVYYTEVNPTRQYYVNAMIRPYDLGKQPTGRTGGVDYQATYSDGTNTYKIRYANEAYFYKNATYVAASGFEAYPGLAYYNQNAGGTNQTGTTGRFIYDTSDSNIKDGYTKVDIGGKTYFTSTEGGEKYIYEVLTDNRLFNGNFTSITAQSGDIAYTAATEYLTAWKALNTDYRITGAFVWNHSYGTTICRGNGSLVFTFHEGYPVYLILNINGVVCYHTYGSGDNIDASEITCTHGMYPSVTGYSIKWYSDSSFTTPLADFTITENTNIYGRYEKNIIKCYEYAYYELSNEVTKSGTKYSYITENEIKEGGAFYGDALLTSETVTSTDSKGNSVETITYKYNNEVVMIRKDRYNEAFSNISMDKDSYLLTGLTYDDSNPSNTITSYVQAQELSLHAYYIRTRYDLTLDPNYTGANTTTDEYKYGESATLTPPTRNGYVFDGWKWYKGNNLSFTEWTEGAPEGNTVVMPTKDVKAEAKWANATYNSDIMYYYQNTSLSYDKEAVAEMTTANIKTADVTIKDPNGNTHTGNLYKNNGVSYVDNSMTYYYASGAALNDAGQYEVDIEDLSAIRKTASVTENDKHLNSAFKMSVSDSYTYSYSLFTKADGTVSTYTTDGAEFTVEYGAYLEYYYGLKTGLVITTVVKDTEGTTAPVTMSGAGTDYYYAQTVAVNASVPSGYTFVGWYKASDVLDGDTLVSDISGATPVSTSASFNYVTKTDTTNLVCVVSAKKPAEPTITMTGVKSLRYLYEAKTENDIVALAKFPETAGSENYVKAYQWYKNGEAISGATANTYLIPEGWGAGTYNLTCKVTVGRSDNSLTAEYTSNAHTLVVDGISMSIHGGDYEAEYTGKYETFEFEVYSPYYKSDYAVYYSETTTLTIENYTTGSTTQPTYKNVEYNDDGTVKTHTVSVYVKSLNSNYNDYSGTYTVTINPKVLTLSAGSQAFTKTYDGTATVMGNVGTEGTDLYNLAHNHNVYTINGIVESEKSVGYMIDCSAVFNDRHLSKANSVTLSNLVLKFESNNTEDKNYKFNTDYTLIISGSIERKPLTVTWGDASFVYDGTEKSPTVSFDTTIPEADAAYLSITKTGAQTIVGDYEAVANLATSSADTEITDFYITNASKEYTIAKRAITIKPNEVEYTYDGNNHSLNTFTVTSGKIVDGQSYSALPSESKKDVGTYEVTAANVVIKDDTTKADTTDNYNITLAESSLVIKKKDVTVSGITVSNKTYDGTTAAAAGLSNLTFTGIEEGDSLSLTASKVTAAFENATVGEDKNVTITIAADALSGDSKDNYNLVVASSQNSATADITKAEITVKADEESSTYGTLTTLSSTMSGFKNNEKATDVVSGTVTYKIATSATSSKVDYAQYTNAGTYTIYPDVSGLTATNYTFKAETNTLTIGKKNITVAAATDAKASKTYDGTKSATVTGLYAFSGVVNSDSVTLTYTAAYDDANVSSDDKVHMTGLSIDNTNYNLTTDEFDIPGEIKQKALTITADNETITYGDDKPTFAVTYDGFVNSETSSVLNGTISYKCVYDTSVAANRKAGTYDIEPSGQSSSNYKITYANGTLTVEKATLTVYPTSTATSAAGDTTPVDMRTSGAVKRTYGDDVLPTINFAIDQDGYVYTEDTDSVVTKPTELDCSWPTTLTTSADDHISAPATTYTLTVKNTGFSADNYVFTAENGSLTVEKRYIHVANIAVNSKVYDGTTDVASGQFDYSGGSITNLTTYDSSSLADAVESKEITVTGKYKTADVATGITVDLTLTLGGELAERYYFKSDNTQKTATADITARPVEIRADNKSVVYGSTSDPAYDVTYFKIDGDNASGLVSGETATKANVTISDPYDETGFTEAGTYKITPSAFANVSGNSVDVSNYAPAYKDGTLTVTKATLSAPTNVKWSTTSLGTVTWSAVSGIGNVNVASYELQLYKGSTAVGSAVTVAATATLSKDFASAIHDNGEGVYTVKIKAIPSTTNNSDKKNVGDSTQGTSDNLYAAKVVVAAANDDISEAGLASGKVNDAASYTMIAGEKDVEIQIKLKNETGYSIKTVTSSDSKLSVAGETTQIITVSETIYKKKISLDAASTITGTITISVALNATPATLSVEVTPRPGTNQAKVTYGYTTAPEFTATASVTSGDNVDESEYTYTYVWQYKEGATTVHEAVTHSNQDNVDTYSVDKNLHAKKDSPDYYVVRCIVTATRKDNGQSVTYGNSKSWSNTNSYVTNFSIDRATFTADTTMEGWTYGETRKAPVVTGRTELDKKNPQIANTVYTYKKESEDESAFTSTFPTDAGTYVVRSVIPEDKDYEGFKTDDETFTISKATLATPDGLAMSASDTAAYGLLSWNSVSGVKENAGADGYASEVTVTYDVSLYKLNGTTWESVRNTISLTKTSLDVTATMQEYGVGTYKFTVKAVSSNTNNVNSSAVAEFTTNFNIEAQIKVGSTISNNKITESKTFDNVAYTLSSVAPSGATVSAYQWYKDGAEVTDGITQTYDVLDVDQSGNYTCRLTIGDNKYVYTPIAAITISKRKVTMTSDDATKAYDGTALTDSTVTATLTDSTVTGDAFPSDQGASYSVTGTITNVGTASNAFTYTLNSGTDSGNYEITTTAGTLTVTARTITDNSNITVASVADLIFNADDKKPEPTVTDSGLNTGVSTSLVKDTDFEYSYTNNFHAGTATVTVTGKGNYSGTKSVNFTIKKKQIKVVPEDYSTVYTGTAITKVATQTYSIQDSSDANSVNSWTFSDAFSATGTSVGEYTYTQTNCTVTDKNGTNIASDLTLTYGTGKMTITQTSDTLTATMDNSTYTYDGTAHANTNSPSVSASATTVTDTTTYTYSFDKNGTYVSDLSSLTQTAAKEYTIYIKASNPNYVNDGEGTAKIIINKREITVGMTGTTTYTGAEQSISDDFSVTSTTQLADNENATIKGKISGTAATTATAKHTTITDKSIVIKHGENDVTDNYTVTWTGELTINKTDDTLKVSMDDYSHVYDGSAHYSNKTASVEGTSTTVTGTTTYQYSFTNGSGYVDSLSSLTKTDAGTYTIYIKATNPNYNNAGTGSAELKIEKRKIKFIGDSDSAEYDGSEHSITTFKTSTADGYYDLVSGHKSNVTYSASGTQYSATAYAGTITAADKVTIKNSAGDVDYTKNYDIETEAGTYTISKRSTSDMTVTFANDTVTYDGAEHNLSAATVSCTGVTILGTTTYTYKFTDGSTTTTDVTTLKKTLPGTYTIEVTAHNDNFTNDVTKTATLTINKRTVTFYTTGSEDYDGTEKTLTLSNTTYANGSLELVNGHKLTGTSTISGTAAKDYTTVTLGTMKVLDASDKDMTDYYTISMTGKLTINKSAMTGTVSLSDYTYDGTAHTPTYTIPDGADYDAPTYTYMPNGGTYSSTAPTDVGTYTVKATWAATNNCLETSTTDTFSITQRAITITGTSATVEYDGQYHLVNTGSITSGSLAEGDNFSATNTCYGDKVGKYTGTISNLYIFNEMHKEVTNNYNVTIVNGELTIEPATNQNFAISLDDYTVTYDAKEHYNENTAETTADIAQLSDSTIQYSFDNSDWKDNLSDLKKTEAGEYTIYVKATNPDFADTATKEVKLTISQRPLSVKTEDTVKYNGSKQTLNVKASDIIGGTSLADGHSLEVTASTSGTTVADYTALDADAVYTIKDAESKDVTKNYEVTVAALLHIIKATDYTASITVVDKTYDGIAIRTGQFNPAFGGPANDIEFSTNGGDYDDYLINFKVKGASDDTYDTDAPVKAGEYTACITYAATNNCESISATDDFTISKRDLEITGESLETAYTGSEIEIDDITTDNLADFDTLSGLTYSAKGTEVTAYPGSFTGTEVITNATYGDVTDSYNITKTPGSLTIKKTSSSWTVSLDKETVVYDGENHHITATPSNTAISGTTTYEYSFDKNGTYVSDLTSLEKKDAGTYTVYVKATNPNYSEVAEACASLIINKRPVDVTPADLTKVYLHKDETLTYEVETQGTNRGLLSGESLTGLTISRVAGEDVNDYAITVTMEEGSNSNYNVNLKTGKYTITPMDISDFSATLANKLIYNGEEQTQNVKDVLSAVIADTTGYIDGAVNEDNQIECDDYVITGNTATENGKYTLTVTGQNNFKGSFTKTYIVGEDGKLTQIGDYEFKMNLSQEMAGTVLNNSEESLILSEATAEQLAKVADGYKLALELNLTWKDEPDVTQDLKDFMETHKNQFDRCYYVRIELFMHIYDQNNIEVGTNQVHETNQMIFLTIILPDDYKNTNSAYERHYALIREHNGTIEQLNGVYDPVNNTVTFESNKFSDYAVTYYDTLIPVNNNYPVVNTSVR